MIQFKYNDGGRSKYFKSQNAGDCVTRAIAIATGKDYKEVYNDMALGMQKITGRKTARNGVFKKVYNRYLLENGFQWVSKMGIGTGMTVHVREEELPKGTVILRLSGHLACVKDGVLHDTYDCSRNGTRGVYGYWIKK